MTVSIEQNREIALRYDTEGFKNFNLWDELLHPDYVYHFCSSETICGIEAAKAFSIGLHEGFPNVKRTIEDTIVEGDRVVFRHQYRGTHTGNFLGIPPTGKEVNIGGITILRFCDPRSAPVGNRQIIEEWFELNHLELMKQLGLS
jgi:predicted ester cyclase